MNSSQRIKGQRSAGDEAGFDEVVGSSKQGDLTPHNFGSDEQMFGAE
jgi:hypothetical protein